LFLLLKNALNLLSPGARKAGSVEYNVQVQTKSLYAIWLRREDVKRLCARTA